MATQAVSPASAGSTEELGSAQVTLASNAQVVYRPNLGTQSQQATKTQFVLFTPVTSYSLTLSTGCASSPAQLTFGGPQAIAPPGQDHTSFGGGVHNYLTIASPAGGDYAEFARVLLSYPIAAPVPFSVACAGANAPVFAHGQPADDRPRAFTRGPDSFVAGQALMRVVQYAPIGPVDTSELGRAVVSRTVVQLSPSLSACYAGQVGMHPVQLVGAPGLVSTETGGHAVFNYRTYVEASLGDSLSVPRGKVHRGYVRPGLLRVSCPGAVVQANLSGAIYVAPNPGDMSTFGDVATTGGLPVATPQTITATGVDPAAVAVPKLSFNLRVVGIDPVATGDSWASFWIREYFPIPGDQLTVGPTVVYNLRQYIEPSGVFGQSIADAFVYIFTPTAGSQDEEGSHTVWLQYQLVYPPGVDRSGLGEPRIADKASYVTATVGDTLLIGLPGGYLRNTTISYSYPLDLVEVGITTLRNRNYFIRPKGLGTAEIVAPAYLGRDPNQVLFPVTQTDQYGTPWVSNAVRYITVAGYDWATVGYATGTLMTQFCGAYGVGTPEVGVALFQKSPKVLISASSLDSLGTPWVSFTPVEIRYTQQAEFLSYGTPAVGWAPWPVTTGVIDTNRIGLASVVETFNRMGDYTPLTTSEYGTVTVREAAILPVGSGWLKFGNPEVFNSDRYYQPAGRDWSYVAYPVVRTNKIEVSPSQPYTEFGAGLVYNVLVLPFTQVVLPDGLDAPEIRQFTDVTLGNPAVSPTGVDTLVMGDALLPELTALTGFSLFNTARIGEPIVAVTQFASMTDPTLDVLEVGAISISPWIVYARPDIPDPPPYSGEWDRLDPLVIGRISVTYYLQEVVPLLQTYTDLLDYWERFGTPEVVEVNAPQYVEPLGVGTFDMWYQTRVLGGTQWFEPSVGVDWLEIGLSRVSINYTGPVLVAPSAEDMLRIGTHAADNYDRPVYPVSLGATELGSYWTSYTPILVGPAGLSDSTTAEWAMVDFRVRSFELQAGDLENVRGWSVWPPTETFVDVVGGPRAGAELGAGEQLDVGLHLIGRTTLCAQVNAS